MTLRRTYVLNTDKGCSIQIKPYMLKGLELIIKDSGHMQPNGTFLYNDVVIVLNDVEIKELLKAISETIEGRV